MNGLFVLIEREKIPSLTIRERVFCAKRENFWLIFDGKLFNRNKLIQNHNLNATAHSDADIALELFIQKNTDAFALLEGYWSLIVADLDKQTVFAARDHFGNRPLYYCKTDTSLGIASESRALFSTLKNAGEINKNAVFDFLLWGNIGKHQQNFFSNIHEIKPSNYLSYSLIDNSLEEKPYYTLPYKNCKAGYNEYEEPFYIDKTRQLVLDTVQDNINGRDKIAIGLSGGMDSSTLLCCAKRLNPDLQIVAFTSANFYDEGETFWAEKIIKHTNVEWVKVFCDSKLIIKQLEEASRIQNIPIFTTASVARHYLMEAASQRGFDAIMGEQGADGLFAGYTDYFLPFLKSLRNQWMFKDWAKELLTISNSTISYKEIASRKLKDLAKKYYYNKERLAKKTKFQELSFLNKAYQNYSYLDNSIADKSVLNDYLYESYTIYLTSLLQFGERSAANFEMNYLTPFSNSKALTECLFSVPSTFKIHNGWTKYLLRSSMVGIVPDEIRWRKQKVDFHLSESNYLNEIGNEMKQHIYELEDADNFIDKTSLLDAWKTVYHSNNFHFQQFVFRYLSYLLWRKGIYE